MQLTYAGEHLAFEPPTGELRDLVEQFQPKEWFELEDHPYLEKGGQFHQFNWKAAPELQINELYLPTGASRYGMIFVLVDDPTYQAILAKMDTTGGAGLDSRNSQELRITDERGEVRFYGQFWCLKERVFYDAPDDRDRVWILPLVDERYWWQFRTITKYPSTTWRDILQDWFCLNNSEIPIIEDEWGVPNTKELMKRFGNNYGILLDVIANSLQFRVVFDYKENRPFVKKYDTDQPTPSDPPQKLPLYPDEPWDYGDFAPQSVPRKIEFHFRKCENGSILDGEFYSKVINFGDVSGQKDWARIVDDGCVKATFFPSACYDKSGWNQPALDAYAQAFADAYLEWASQSFDVTYNQIVDINYLTTGWIDYKIYRLGTLVGGLEIHDQARDDRDEKEAPSTQKAVVNTRIVSWPATVILPTLVDNVYGQEVEDPWVTTTTTTTTAEPDSDTDPPGNNCEGTCEYEWDSTTKAWTKNSDSCAVSTTTTTTTTTTAGPTTTTTTTTTTTPDPNTTTTTIDPNLCECPGSDDGTPTTTTTTSTTTTSTTPLPSDCICHPPNECGLFDEEKRDTFCFPDDGTEPQEPQCTTCDCNTTTTTTTTTLAPECTDCDWKYLPTGGGGWSWIKLRDGCAGDCQCYSPTDPGTECEEETTACVMNPPPDPPPPQRCSGHCEWLFSTDLGRWIRLFWRCRQISGCDCRPPSVTGSEADCDKARTPCETPNPEDPESCEEQCTTTTTNTPEPCFDECTWRADGSTGWLILRDPCDPECPCPEPTAASPSGSVSHTEKTNCGNELTTTTTTTTTAAPTGACCVGIENEFCINAQTEAQCDSSGGVWHSGVDCSALPCPTTTPVPCSNADCTMECVSGVWVETPSICTETFTQNCECAGVGDACSEITYPPGTYYDSTCQDATATTPPP